MAGSITATLLKPLACFRAAVRAEPPAAARAEPPPEAAGPALPPEIISRITEIARELYFEPLTPKAAALAAAAFAPHARTSPNLHKYMREHCLKVGAADDIHTLALKLRAFEALSCNLPAIDREPGESPPRSSTPIDARAVARMHMMRILDDNAALDPPLRSHVQSKQLSALARSIRSEQEWFATCDEAMKLIRRRALTKPVAHELAVRLAKRLPREAEKHALIYLAQVRRDGVDMPASEIEPFVRPAVNRLPPEQRRLVLAALDMPIVDPRETAQAELVRRRAEIETERADLAQRSAEIEAALERMRAR